MEEIIKIFFDKISSYNIFNNLFPGVVFCYLFTKTTNFNLGGSDWFINIFVYYFVGMVISRIGSTIIYTKLNKIEIKKKNSTQKEKILKFADYKDYKIASKDDPFIAILSETNNTYRTLLAMSLLLFLGKIFSLIYERFLANMSYSKNIIEILALVFLIVLFLLSYIKQTSYVRNSVELHMKNLTNNNGEE